MGAPECCSTRQWGCPLHGASKRFGFERELYFGDRGLGKGGWERVRARETEAEGQAGACRSGECEGRGCAEATVHAVSSAMRGDSQCSKMMLSLIRCRSTPSHRPCHWGHRGLRGDMQRDFLFISSLPALLSSPSLLGFAATKRTVKPLLLLLLSGLIGDWGAAGPGLRQGRLVPHGLLRPHGHDPGPL